MTKLKLFLSAQKAALESLDEKSAHAIHLVKATVFNADGMHPDDFEYWNAAFDNQRSYLSGLRVPSPSKVNADAAAALAAKAATETK